MFISRGWSVERFGQIYNARRFVNTLLCVQLSPTEGVHFIFEYARMRAKPPNPCVQRTHSYPLIRAQLSASTAQLAVPPTPSSPRNRERSEMRRTAANPRKIRHRGASMDLASDVGHAVTRGYARKSQSNWILEDDARIPPVVGADQSRRRRGERRTSDRCIRTRAARGRAKICGAPKSRNPPLGP